MKILVAGVGNIFLGDDAFGVEVAQRLLKRSQPDGVLIVDFGIRGLDLAYSSLDGYDAVIVVDAMPRGGRPGTLYVLEPEVKAGATMADQAALVEGHNLDPARVLQLVTALGGRVDRLVVVGCEPGLFLDDDLADGMSLPVATAIDSAVEMVESMVASLLDGTYSERHRSRNGGSIMALKQPADLRRTFDQGNGRLGELVVERIEENATPIALVGLGLIAAGVGLWAWTYLGPDLRRYIKMSSM